MRAQNSWCYVVTPLIIRACSPYIFYYKRGFHPLLTPPATTFSKSSKTLSFIGKSPPKRGLLLMKHLQEVTLHPTTTRTYTTWCNFSPNKEKLHLLLSHTTSDSTSNSSPLCSILLKKHLLGVFLSKINTNTSPNTTISTNISTKSTSCSCFNHYLSSSPTILVKNHLWGVILTKINI